MEILDDIRESALSLNDLRSELAREIFSTSVQIRFRIVQIIMAKSNLGIDFESIPLYLSQVDFIDKKLELFRSKYQVLSVGKPVVK